MATIDAEIVTLASDDADALFDVAKANDLAELGQLDFTHSDITDVLRGERNQVWGVPGGDGNLRAAAWLEDRAHRSAVEAEFLLPPTATAEDGRRLVELALEHQRADPQRRPIHAFAQNDNRRKQELYAGYGGAVIRHFFRMALDLDDWTAQEVQWPADTTVDVADLSGPDLRSMYDVMDTAFQDHWEHTSSPYNEWVQRNTSRDNHDPSLWWLVRRGGTPVAGLIGAIDDDQGYVGVLGTLRAARKLGLGRRLLLTAFNEFAARGCSHAGLHCDATNPTGAVSLYESVGMQVALHYACYELKPE